MSGFSLSSPAVHHVSNYLRKASPEGATDAEIQEALDFSRATVCAARKLLVEEGLAEWTGVKRVIPMGQWPKVWRMKHGSH